MRRRHFLSTSVASSLALGGTGWAQNSPGPKDLHPAKPIGLAPPKEKDLPKDVSLTVKEENLRILQVTDIHFFADRDKHGEKADRRTVHDIEKIANQTNPHLIAVTGDLWHDNPGGKGQEFFEYAIDKITTMGLPWLFTWGNHDLLTRYGPAQSTLTKAKGSLYRGAYSEGNYQITIKDSAGEPRWDLLCLNTTTQGVQERQEKWLRAQKPSSRPTLCFLHIPLLEYDTVWKKKLAKGIFNEAVCTYGEDGSAFDLIKGLGVKACFCGHDHVNDYGGRIKGVEMVYGRATGHAGYGGDKIGKGAKLITAKLEEETYEWKSVFADGSEWMPRS